MGFAYRSDTWIHSIPTKNTLIKTNISLFVVIYSTFTGIANILSPISNVIIASYSLLTYIRKMQLLDPEIPRVYEQLIDAVPDDPTYDDAHNLAQLTVARAETLGLRKGLLFYALGASITEIAPAFPHVDNPLHAPREELKTTYLRDTRQFKDRKPDGPTLIELSSDMGEIYVMRHIQPAISNLAFSQQLVTAVVEDTLGETDIINNGLRAGFALNSTVASRQSRLIERSLFGASRSIFYKLFAEHDINSPEDFQKKRAEIAAVLQSRQFSYKTSGLASGSNGEFFRALKASNLLSNFQKEEVVNNKSRSFREIPIGCPAGNLIFWAPKFLFSVCDAVTELHSEQS